MSDASHHPTRKRARDIAVAAACGVFVAMMVGMAFAAVPFYNWFCRATGFGGTTQVATAAPAGVLDRKIAVRFDANIGPGLPWRFEPEVNAIDVRIGEVATVYFTIVNQSARQTLGQAAYNVAPTTVGAYFSKINCFCFTEQRLRPGEKREMAVVFFVDPALAKDADQDDLNTITLSYTFYPLHDPQSPVADNTTPAAPGRL
jgi:cytochrome c oxidase assembly protein subunit 11